MPAIVVVPTAPGATTIEQVARALAAEDNFLGTVDVVWSTDPTIPHLQYNGFNISDCQAYSFDENAIVRHVLRGLDPTNTDSLRDSLMRAICACA